MEYSPGRRRTERAARQQVGTPMGAAARPTRIVTNNRRLMSLLIVADREPERAALPGSPVSRALRAALDQGFAAPEHLAWPGGAAWWHATPHQPEGTGGVLVRQGAAFAAAVGTLSWHGRDAAACLRALLDAPHGPQAVPWQEWSGSFLLLLGRPDGVWLLGDALGLLRLYEAEGCGVLSSSLLACVAARGAAEADPVRAREYVLLGAHHGPQTPLRGVRSVEPGVRIELHAGARRVAGAPVAARVDDRPARFEAAVAAVAGALRDEFAALAGAHEAGGTCRARPPIGMALSGGFDSRLLLAALDSVGRAPALYVYGRAGDDDVEVARAVAGRCGLSIECIDKSKLASALPPLDGAALQRQLRFFDGLPVDGIFDRGVDRATRLQQVVDGRLNLNGGGGEILRNFFYLPEGGYSASDVQGAFYSAWLDEVFHSGAEREEFLALVADDILRSLGRAAGSAAARRQQLPRHDVELVYTTYRLRWWMGRNNSAAARYGAFLTPLVTPALVGLAAGLPLAFKEYGRLEAAVIRTLSPRVAAGPSAYGFSFADGPGVGQRLRVQSTLRRPIWLRHQSVRVQRWLGRLPTPKAPAEWTEALGEAPRDDWLDPAALTSIAQVNRLLTLQALLRFGP